LSQQKQQQEDTNDTDGDGLSSPFFASATAFPDFASIGIQSPVLLRRLEALGLTRPTAVQAAAFAMISSSPPPASPSLSHDHDQNKEPDEQAPEQRKQGDVTVGAETGSGKV
jgi:superfamily II DNA/RNA helicase